MDTRESLGGSKTFNTLSLSPGLLRKIFNNTIGFFPARKSETIVKWNVLIPLKTVTHDTDTYTPIENMNPIENTSTRNTIREPQKASFTST